MPLQCNKRSYKPAGVDIYLTVYRPSFLCICCVFTFLNSLALLLSTCVGAHMFTYVTLDLVIGCSRAKDLKLDLQLSQGRELKLTCKAKEDVVTCMLPRGGGFLGGYMNGGVHNV